MKKSSLQKSSVSQNHKPETTLPATNLISCDFETCEKGYLDILAKDRDKKQKDHVRKYHDSTKGLEIDVNEARFIFRRDEHSNHRYICVCLRSFKNSDSLRIHIRGKVKVRKPCKIIRSFADDVVKNQRVFQSPMLCYETKPDRENAVESDPDEGTDDEDSQNEIVPEDLETILTDFAKIQSALAKYIKERASK